MYPRFLNLFIKWLRFLVLITRMVKTEHVVTVDRYVRVNSATPARLCFMFVMYQSYPGNLITIHRGWEIWSLGSILWNRTDSTWVYKSWQRRLRSQTLLNLNGKRLRICGGLVEDQRPTQALIRIWRCLRRIYIQSIHVNTVLTRL